MLSLKYTIFIILENKNISLNIFFLVAYTLFPSLLTYLPAVSAEMSAYFFIGVFYLDLLVLKVFFPKYFSGVCFKKNIRVVVTLIYCTNICINIIYYCHIVKVSFVILRIKK